MKNQLIAVLLAIMMLSTTACGAVNTLVNATGKSSGTVTSLWSDVPPLDGAKKANIDMPLAARLVMQTMVKGMSQGGGSMDFIAFTTTKTPADVQNFYTQARMTAAGWQENTTGCTGEETNGAANIGTLCLFGKTEGAKDVGLAIVVALDDQTKQTQVFYVRFSDTGTPTPKP